MVWEFLFSVDFLSLLFKISICTLISWMFLFLFFVKCPLTPLNLESIIIFIYYLFFTQNSHWIISTFKDHRDDSFFLQKMTTLIELLTISEQCSLWLLSGLKVMADTLWLLMHHKAFLLSFFFYKPVESDDLWPPSNNHSIHALVFFLSKIPWIMILFFRWSPLLL